VVRLGTDDRPATLYTGTNRPYTIIYETGNAACSAIGGTCSRMLIKSTLNGTWTIAGGALGSCSQNRNSSGNSYYFMAECTGVPKVAGCENCPDPDCTVQLSGGAYDATTKTLLSSEVIVRTEPQNILSNLLNVTTTTITGKYDYNVYPGNVRVMCTAAGYRPYITTAFLQRGKNLVDCQMTTATCSPDCTLPDIYGNEICRASCDASNSCYFGNEEVKNTCDGLPKGTFVSIRRINDTHVAGIRCCNETIVMERPLFEVSGDKIKNLITKSFRKEFNGIPVSLKIIVYEKE